MYFLNVASGISPSTPSVCVWALRWTFITWRASVYKKELNVTLKKKIISDHSMGSGNASLALIPCLSAGHAGLWWWRSYQNGTRWWAWSRCCPRPWCRPSVRKLSWLQPAPSSESSGWWWCQPRKSPNVRFPSFCQSRVCFIETDIHLSNGDGLLLHGLMDRHPVVLSHLKSKCRSEFWSRGDNKCTIPAN